jgi:hypothetical protein
MSWHDLRGQTAPKAEDAKPEKKAEEKSLSLQSPESGTRGTGDIISRLGSDAGIVGESLTRELSEGLRYVYKKEYT